MMNSFELLKNTLNIQNACSCKINNINVGDNVGDHVRLALNDTVATPEAHVDSVLLGGLPHHRTIRPHTPCRKIRVLAEGMEK